MQNMRSPASMCQYRSVRKTPSRTTLRHPVRILILVICLSTSVLAGAQDGPVPAGPAFTLGVGDVLTISIWKSPDLTSTVQVQPDGMISLPLINEIPAAGKSPSELRTTLTESYKRFVTSPSVSVVVAEINSRKIYVVGEVQSPGEFDMLRPMTLMQAIAKAGGFTEFANKDGIVVLRSQSRSLASFKKIVSGKDPGDNLLLQPDDTIVIP